MERGSISSYLIVGILSGLIGGLIFGILAYTELSPKVVEVPTTQGEGLVLGYEDIEEETVIYAYNEVAPSVVHITSTVLTTNFFMEVVPQEGVGSGVVVSSDGYILTNNHVIEGAEFIKVVLQGGKALDATLIGADPSTDLAVLKIDPSGLELKPAILGDSDVLRVGMRAMAIGNPFGLDRTITVGVISALNRSLSTDEGYIIPSIIQTDASINPGNSGGPLINSKGEVIGINSAILSPVRGSVGIGFAIPINLAKKVMVQLIEKGSVAHPWIGISGVTLTQSMIESLGIQTDAGVLIVDVVPGGPADRAGLRGGTEEKIVGNIRLKAGGDVIIELEGMKISSMEDLVQRIFTREVGDVVKVGFIRGGEKEIVAVTLGKRP